MNILAADFTVGATALGKINPNPFGLITSGLQLCARTDQNTTDDTAGWCPQPNLVGGPEAWKKNNVVGYIASEPLLNGYPSNGVDTSARGWLYRQSNLTSPADDAWFIGQIGEPWQSIFTLQFVMAIRDHHTEVAGPSGGTKIFENYQGLSDMFQVRLTTNAADHASATPATPYLGVYMRRDTPSAAVYSSSHADAAVNPTGWVGPIPRDQAILITATMSPTVCQVGWNLFRDVATINHQAGSTPMNDPWHIDQDWSLTQSAEWNIAFGPVAAYNRVLSNQEIRSNAIQFAQFYNFFDTLA